MADARSVIEALTQIEPETTDPYKKISEEQGEQIAALFEGNIGLFIELDERPGKYTTIAPIDDWHYKLRQARNNCRRFFEILSTAAKENAGT